MQKKRVAPVNVVWGAACGVGFGSLVALGAGQATAIVAAGAFAVAIGAAIYAEIDYRRPAKRRPFSELMREVDDLPGIERDRIMHDIAIDTNRLIIADSMSSIIEALSQKAKDHGLR